jgi:hypothetical protein
MEERLIVLEERLVRAERELKALRRRVLISAALFLATVVGGLVLAEAQPSKRGSLLFPNPPPSWLFEFPKEEQRAQNNRVQIIGGGLVVDGSLRVAGSLMLKGPIRVLGSSGKTGVEINADHPDGAIALKDASGKTTSRNQ